MKMHVSDYIAHVDKKGHYDLYKNDVVFIEVKSTKIDLIHSSNYLYYVGSKKGKLRLKN